jgi:hypothetical protein
MANKIKQFRYYAEGSTPSQGNEKNQPIVIAHDSGSQVPVSYSHYCSGLVFGDAFPILQLGVQALPGTKFYLNNALEPIIIGSTGIYELDLGGQTEITAINFDMDSMELIRDNNSAFLIVDIIYDDGKE